ncbi:MAG TPA: S8 family serine peptidase [Streptosporangiaceae bacterium]|nr:S8 family serine peptidase [Streptosporangiaceae bacterium]
MPLTIPRLAKAAVAISFASVPLIGFSAPALASTAASASAAIPVSAADTTPSYEWWLRTLHIAQAWNWGNGAGVTVAVLSDGVVTGRRYLAGTVISGPDFTRSGRTASSRYFGVVGTSLASLIAGHGVGDFGQGSSRASYGVAPGAKVLSVRVTLSPGDPLWSDSKVTARLPSAIAAGIRYAVARGARVIDLPADPGVRDAAIASGSAAATGGSQAERSAVRDALKQNVVLIAPAGDNGQAGDAANYPAAYHGVIAVGAFDRAFDKAPYSSKQPYVTLTAAGQGVIAAGRAGFHPLNSTCAASALVAGIAALIRAEFPDLAVAQVRNSMTGSTVYHPRDGMRNGSGYGTVDAIRAIRSAATMAPPHARPAMLGARPRTRPLAPSARSSGSLIMHQLTGDAAISGVVLALLLIPIGLYGIMARRRDQQEAALAAAQSSQRSVARSGHGTMLADPLLEFFGPQHARPASQSSSSLARTSAAPRFQPKPGLTGRSTMSAALGGRSAAAQAGPGNGAVSESRLASPPAVRQPPGPMRAAGAPARPGTPAPAGPASPDLTRPAAPHSDVLPARQLADGPGGFDSTVRRTPVTGSPPWEPAMQPTSELPWAVISPPPVGSRPASPDTPPIPPPPDSVWDSAPAHRSAAPGSLFQPAPVAPGHASREHAAQDGQGLDQRTPPARAGRSAAARRAERGAGRPADIERGPIFSWNSSAAAVTDQFTSVDPATTDWSRATGGSES